MTQHNRISRAALLAAILLLTAAGCAAGKPASGAPKRVSAEANAGLVRLSGNGSLTQTPGNPTGGKAELALGTGSLIELVKDTAIQEGEEPALTVTLTGLEFSESLDKEQFQWENLPAGLDFAVERVDGITARITLSGTPAEVMEKTGLTLYLGRGLFQVTDHQDNENSQIDEIDDIIADVENDRITARGNVFICVQPPQPTISNVKSAKLTGEQIGLTAGAAIREGEAPVLTVALTGLEFSENLDKEQFRWENLPQGLDFTVARVDGATAEITLSGTPAEAAEETQLRLIIGKDQVRPQSDLDIPATGSVTIVVAAASGGLSPVILAVCGAAAAAVIAAAAAVAVTSSRKKKPVRRQQDAPAAGISKTENIRREPERRDMPNQQNNPNAALPTSAAPRQNPQADVQKSSGTVQIGKLHNIGCRSAQQDSMGSMNLGSGSDVFAVVADGMGGLSGGDQVSQGVVMSMLQQAGSLKPGQMDGVLGAMVRGANEEINRQLGPDGIYHSGSTVVAVLVRGSVFHWISVGDSRIYLYRGGSMLQLNQEHTYEVELMQRVMNGEITAAEAASDPQRRGLTSFIGMGRLKYVDASRRPVALQSGDRILLMTDGVFNNLPEAAMADTLRRNPDVQQAAKVLEEQVLALQDAAQDNFTAIILGFQG